MVAAGVEAVAEVEAAVVAGSNSCLAAGRAEAVAAVAVAAKVAVEVVVAAEPGYSSLHLNYKKQLSIFQ